MARKVFISVLGTGNYGLCKYVKGDYTSSSLRFIQEATLGYLCSEETWGEGDIVYILLTKGAECVNWLDNGHRDRNTGEVLKCEGLCSCLSRMELPFAVNTIKDLPDGSTESEIWEIFERVFHELQDGDELYFDLTHGFRYLPMLVMVLINYSKFLKHTSVKSITYGNYESRNSDNVAPIIDLLPLSVLQDWTFASGQFLDSGDVHRLVSLCTNEIRPILKLTSGRDIGAATLREFVKHLQSVMEERQSCRGMSIIKSESLRKLKSTADSLDTTIIKPLNPVFEKIKHSLDDFDEEENVMNGYSAAVWCYHNNMLQQSATILQEFVISYFCVRHGIKIDDEDKRDLVTSAFAIRFNNIQEANWAVSAENKECLRRIMDDDLLASSKIVELFNNLSEVRNDINHSGMRSKRLPLKSKAIKDNIKKCIDGFGVLQVESCEFVRKEHMIMNRLFLNLTNHPSSIWSNKQLEAAREYGEVVDLPFPVVDECGGEKYIFALADEYFQKIKEYAKNHIVTVHLMGEMTFTFALLNRLQKHNILCVASTTKRIVKDVTPGHRAEVTFEFERFRKYE